MAQDQTFALDDGHYALVGGKVFGPWPDKGSADAGMKTEQRRLASKSDAMQAIPERIHVVIDENGLPDYSAIHPTLCHDHIKDVMQNFPDTAKNWVVREYVLAG